MRVIGYTRVSTDKQAEEGVSLLAQATKIESYCVVKDWTVGEIISDDGYSAKTLKRPGLEYLLSMVKAKEVDVIIIAKLDRLSRSVKDIGQLLETFNRYSVALVSLAESLDVTTAAGRLVVNILASVAQWEREAISERTRDSMQYLKRMGRTFGRPPCQDRVAIEIMQQDRANGMSYQAIAHHLIELDLKTTRGGQWQPCTIEKILKRAAAA